MSVSKFIKDNVVHEKLFFNYNYNEYTLESTLKTPKVFSRISQEHLIYSPYNPVLEARQRHERELQGMIFGDTSGKLKAKLYHILRDLQGAISVPHYIRRDIDQTRREIEDLLSELP